MQCYKRHILSLVIIVLSFIGMAAQDSITVSVLTCTPGKDVYAKFGHTAIRVTDHGEGNDFVFNYGCFNYNADSFLLKFLLGQTDYMLEAEPMGNFMYRYEMMGNGVTEQVLNLTAEEKSRLFQMLIVNLQPENQEYRYKWMGNNCTDRARMMVEDAMAAESKSYVMYIGDKDTRTVREILHDCLKEVPWVSFGVDILLGQEIDDRYEALSDEARKKIQMFIPNIFMAEASQAIIKQANGKERAYVSTTHELTKASYMEDTPSPLTPNVVFGTLLALMLLLSFTDIKRKTTTTWVDASLLIAEGVVGILIAFMFFFSEHPAVGSNWLVVIFNPIPLFYAGWMISCSKKSKRNKLAIVNVAVLAAFLLTMWLCPQSFNTAMYMLVSALLTRAVSHFIIEKKPA